MRQINGTFSCVNSLCHSGAIWRHRSGSTLDPLYWLVAYAVTWTYHQWESVTISQEVLKLLIRKMRVKSHCKLLPHLSGTNELNYEENCLSWSSIQMNTMVLTENDKTDTDGHCQFPAVGLQSSHTEATMYPCKHTAKMSCNKTGTCEYIEINIRNNAHAKWLSFLNKRNRLPSCIMPHIFEYKR